MSGLHLTGYRPLVTRRIGQVKTKAELKPIDDAFGHATEAMSQLAERVEPEHGFSNWEAYAPDEVLLDDLAARSRTEPPYALPLPRPLASLSSPGELAVLRLDVGAPGTSGASLAQASALRHGGEVYTFEGFLLLMQHDAQLVAPPPTEVRGVDLYTTTILVLYSYQLLLYYY